MQAADPLSTPQSSSPTAEAVMSRFGGTVAAQSPKSDIFSRVNQTMAAAMPPQPLMPQSASEPTAPPPPVETPVAQPTREFSPEEEPVSQSEERASAEELFPGVVKPVAEEIVYEWQGISRPFKQRNKQYYVTVGLLVFLVSLILFFMGQLLFVGVVISVGFLAYVLSAVPPGQAHYQLTTYGVRIEDQLYFWEELGRFWFAEKFGQSMLHIEVGRFPWRLLLMLDADPQRMDDLRLIISEVLIEQKPPDTFFDKAGQWLQQKLPLDTR